MHRSFGLVLAVGFAILTGLRYLLAGTIAWWLLGLALGFLGAGLLAPAWLEPLRKAWLKLASLLGAVNARILLTVLFACLITPMAFLLRLLGKRPIDLGWDQVARSYWRLRRADEFTAERMERQF